MVWLFIWTVIENATQQSLSYLLWVYFFTVNHTIILPYNKRCKTKLHTLFHHEDSIKSDGFNRLLLIIHIILTLKTLWSYTENLIKKKHSFLVISAHPSGNPLGFCKNLLEVGRDVESKRNCRNTKVHWIG